MEKSEIIKKIVTSFIRKNNRKRSLLELNNSKKRNKFVVRMNRNWRDVFDERMFEPTPKGTHNAKALIEYIPIRKEVLCYIISIFDEYDDVIVTFETALNEYCTGAGATIIYDYINDVIFIEEEQEIGAPGRFVGKIR